MKTLTTYQAWMKVARAYEKRLAGGYDVDGLATTGLCNAVRTMYGRQAINYDQYRVMVRQIEEALRERRDADGMVYDPTYLHPLYDTGEGLEIRAMLAFLHAELSRD